MSQRFVLTRKDVSSKPRGLNLFRPKISGMNLRHSGECRFIYDDIGQRRFIFVPKSQASLLFEGGK